MSEDWEVLLTQNPKILWGLVADVVKAVKASEGGRRTGRRPAVSVESFDELYEILFPPAYSEQPFTETLSHALKARGYSQHGFAAAVGFNQATVSRLISGRTEPTVEVMERVAYTLKIQPTYFAEYRALKLGQIVTDALREDPHRSADAIRRLVGVS